MKIRSVGLFVVALALVIGWANPSHALLCYTDSKENGTGVLVKWPKLPVPYYINASKTPAGVAKADAIAAIKKAFDAYAAVTCTTLKFDYKGESTSISDVPDAILVYFDDTAGVGAYYAKMEWNTAALGDINKGVIMMNGNGYGWTVGAAANKIDIQTAVTQMLPWTLGYYVGDDPWGGSQTSSIKYNYVQTDLTADQKLGAQVIYPGTGSGCTTPPKPSLWCKTIPKPDGVKDSSVKTEKGAVGNEKSTPGNDINVTKKDAGSGDTGGPTQPKDDGGCCRVSHARTTGDAYFALLGIGVFALLVLRRRRR
jgi:hypothetical protein